MLKAFIASTVALAAQSVQAQTTTALYGDDDGFGVGATSGAIVPTTSNQDPGEAPLTDTRLISASFTDTPAFAPTGGFAFTPLFNIVSATLTLRTGSFDSSPPLDGPNVIMLDGLTVDPLFINSFSSNNTDLVETRSFALDSSFFALLADGNVSLAGTRLSEANQSGSFQVDFLRLDIVTASVEGAVPEPSTWAMMLIGFGAVGFSMRRQRRQALAG